MATKARGPYTVIPLPDPFLPFVAVADLVRADTETDLVKHAIVRGAFMNALVNDARVLAIFDLWSRHTRIGELAGAAAAALDEVATRAGLEDRARLFEDEELVLPRKLDEVAQARLDQAREDIGTIGARAVKHEGQNLIDVLTGFAGAQLGLRWAFVPFELARTYWLLVEAHIMGWTTVTMTVHADVLPDVQAFDTVLERAGEALLTGKATTGDPEALLERVYQNARGAFEQLRAVPKGRAPKNEGAHLEEYARWFYRNRVGGESINSIAKDYTAAHRGPDVTAHDHPTIMNGIAEAERLLNLVEFHVR